MLFTVGGTNEILSSGSLFFGTVATLGGIAVGVEIPSDFYSNDITQSVFFECRFDSEFKPKQSQFDPLAEDFISGFLQENNSIITYNRIKYKDFYILSYYDSKAKQLILRKFEDGYSF